MSEFDSISASDSGALDALKDAQTGTPQPLSLIHI